MGWDALSIPNQIHWSSMFPGILWFGIYYNCVTILTNKTSSIWINFHERAALGHWNDGPAEVNCNMNHPNWFHMNHIASMPFNIPFIQYPIAQECNLHQYAAPDSTPLHRIPSAGAENTLAGGKLSNIEELHNMHY